MIWLALACTPGVPYTGSPAPQCDQSYAVTGQPLLTTYCTTCHGQTNQLGGVRLDTLEAARTHAERADARVVEGTMPPGGGLLPDEAEALHAWLSCGAPGHAQDPAEHAVSDDPHVAVELTVEVQELGDGRFVVVRSEMFTGVPWSEELWVVQDDGLALQERTRPIAGVTVTDAWAPPLRMYSSTQRSWVQQVERTRTDDIGSDTWSETWEASRWQQVDARAVSKDDVRGFQMTEGQGATNTVLLSEPIWLATRSWEPLDGVEVWQQSTTVDVSDEPLQDGLFWNERALAWR